MLRDVTHYDVTTHHVIVIYKHFRGVPGSQVRQEVVDVLSDPSFLFWLVVTPGGGEAMLQVTVEAAWVRQGLSDHWNI